MTREEQIKQQADKYIGHSEDFGEDINTTIERIAFIEGAKWADNNHDKKYVYTKQELLNMGFAFDLNGNIRTPNECYESAIKYTEYRKQKLIDRGCEYLYLTLRNSYDEDGIHKVVSGNSLTEFIEGFKKYICGLK